jgi:hypothetical protein
MKCNHFENIEEIQPGDQPIRVFYKLIEIDFLRIRDSINALGGDLNIKHIKFEYLTENIKIIGPRTNEKKITLHDSFLSFLWGYIYSIVVNTPMGGKVVNEKENIEARKLRKYAHSLMWEYSYWDKETLINPELYEKDEKRLIGVSNSIFLFSVRFILFHEFAHNFLGHPFNAQEDRKNMEYDADQFAMEWTIQTLEKDDVFTGRMAIIAALNALSYSPNEFFETETHPPAENRIMLKKNEFGR